MKTHRPSPPATALVIGGGIIGLCAAINLQKSGIAVTVVEPLANPQGASWGNAGHIAVEQVQPLASPATVRSAAGRLYPRGGLAFPVREIATWGPFALRMLRASTPARCASGTAALTDLLAGAMPAWRRLVAISNTCHMLREDGHFIAWESKASAAKGRAAWQRADTGTATVRDATPDELAMILRLAPGALIAGAIRFAGSGQIAHLGRLAQSLRKTLIGTGGTIRQAAVDAIHADSGTAFAMIAGERCTADHIVVCAGAASAGLLRPMGVRLPLIAERGYHIQSAQNGSHEEIPPVVFEDRSMIVTRFTDALRAASFVEFARQDAPPDPGKWRKLHSHVAALGLPFDLPGTQWIGARPTLPDYLPAIGQSRRAANLLYAFGHQHLGLTLAATTGEAIAALATGRIPMMDLSPFDPARFGGMT